jgi:hypothetical protein
LEEGEYRSIATICGYATVQQEMMVAGPEHWQYKKKEDRLYSLEYNL